MRKIGFIISKKENENRRAIVFEDIKNIKNKNNLYFEENYFQNFGYTDLEVQELGVNVLPYKDIIEKCDVIIEPKIGDSEDLRIIKNKILFGWIHATQNYDITQDIIDSKNTAIAFEKMFEGDRHSFNINNQIAGRAAVYHSMLCYGKLYTGLEVAILGNGNTSIGAKDALSKIGANVRVYTKEEENDFKRDLEKYDVIVNAILWDTNRIDHIIYKEDLKRMKKDSIIIDISCDRAGGIETSVPTTIDNPTYCVEGVMHYAVDHTPSFLYKEATSSISKELIKYIDLLVTEEEENNLVIKNAIIIKNGQIIDDEINKFQNRD